MTASLLARTAERLSVDTDVGAPRVPPTAGPRTSDLQGCVVHLDADDLSDAVHVDIVGEEARFAAKRYRGDHAVDEAPRRYPLPPARAIDARRAVEVGGAVEAEKFEAQKKPTEVPFILVGPGPSQHLHNDRVGDDEWTILSDQVGEAYVDRTAGGPVVFDPRRGVGEDHQLPVGVVSSGISPMAWAPRMANASSRLMG